MQPLDDDLTASQETSVSLLKQPGTYGADDPVEVIETHGAFVFLVGDRAWKMKRAVHYDYLDQSTPERRRNLLGRERALNIRTAPDLYEAVVPLDAEGRIDGPGEPVEWLLRMRRFPAGDELSAVAAGGRLTDALACRIGREVADFHGICAVRPEDGAVLMAEILDELARVLPELRRIFGATADLYAERGRAALRTVAPLLSARGADGLVRRGHGDLHLRNIVLLDGRPVPFDALEFDERLGTCDVLYDLAFLLMDLRHRGHDRAACLALNAWLAAFRPPQEEGLAAMPLFLSIRAAIRAMVEAQAAVVADHGAEHAGEARRYLADAFAYLQHGSPVLVALGGLSGSGKSTLARIIAHRIGPPPGAVVLRSDVIRKAQAGVSPTRKLPGSAYSIGATEAVYAEMRARAENALRAGSSVILDAVHGRAEDRRAAAAVAEAVGVPFRAAWIDAPPPVLLRRIEARGNDASDADASVVAAQITQLGEIDWPTIENGDGPDEGTARLAQHLGIATA